ncbi:transporter [Desulfonema ishimotonii]|uniref:Transporter n=1 Tax=Desulfonema ishimotonii TaxID=45657 RepID=A0A401G040_9BACT|nr:aspartate:alanine exchanger family transporter [Desulfonema ishimotonii]GBC62591.1 transporter [Desulfonema ishimotonii]
MQLLSDTVFLLLMIIIIGFMIGQISIKAFSLDSSAIIFVGVVMGYFGYALPNELQTLGLVLFIYSIGLQAGPGFLASLRKNGLSLSLGAVCVVVAGFLTTLICAWMFGFDKGISAGLFAGALTSTPGLAVAVEMLSHSQAAAAYGVTYTFGVIGVIIFIKLLPGVLRVDIPGEEHALEQELRESQPQVTYTHIEVTNPNLFDKPVKDIFLDEISSLTITRLLRKGAGEPILVSGETTLKDGDHIRVVGLEEDLEKAKLYIGRPIAAEIAFNSSLLNKRIFVSRPEIIGSTLRSLNLSTVYNIRVARITRNGFDIPATANTRLNKGDILHIVGQEESVRNIRQRLGNDARELYTASVISILLGIFAGFLAGRVPFFIPGLGQFTLGTTGGVLLAGLVLGHLKKTGPLVWDVPVTTNAFIRELGLMIFLAVVGTSAGGTIVETLRQFGVQLVIAGAMVTLIPLGAAFCVCHYILNIRFLRTLGVLTGGMTSTPGLATAASVSQTQYPSTAYATVYPVALIGMILLTKVLIHWLP